MNRTIAEGAIILAPRGRDAAVAQSMLREAGLEAATTSDLPGLVRLLRGGAGFAVVTEEAVRGADLRELAAFLTDQAEWSDFPFILLTERGGGIERNPAAVRLLETLGNVTFLERPFHPTTLISLARSALRARRRQYEARTRLEAIREGEERLRLALDAGGLGSWVFDIATRAISGSETFRAQFGRRPDDPVDYDVLVASIHPDDLDHRQHALRHSLETGEDYLGEYRCIWPDGSEHWIQTRGRVERGPGGEPLRMVGVSQDITERRDAEDALVMFAAELEERVEQRTAEREAVSAQLHEAQKLETLGQLTGGVAHDFNNLLTPVIGNLDMLRRLHEDERSQRLLGSALEAAERAKTLVSRLLSFARRQTLEARPIDTAAVIGGMLDFIRRTIGPHIDVALDVPDGLPAAMVDPNQLELALLNLSVNARDAMPEGGRLAISVALEQLCAPNPWALAPGGYIALRIADTGTGMDEETLRRAIEPFYSTKGIGKGTGLGLSMVHGLAAQSGGALRLQSAPGEGTTAELLLPLAHQPAEQIALHRDEPIPRMSRLHVLLVDDEELVRRGTAEMLTDLGHGVVQAASGAQALRLLRTARYDVMVSDYLMPGMTGLDLAADARRIVPGLPVLLISGFADVADGFSGDIPKLAKPFRQNELAGALAQVVEGAGQEKEAAE
ncbi:response regulator [Sphingomonas oligophenolica]|uniref:histidine kinase n=1 Tax=Sphingomonas oligophenolica TaxID=301154 RepID=A0ABU9Y0N4_9SPHN